MLSKSNTKKKTWSEVIKLVESANLEQSEQIRWDDIGRKNAYRNQLNLQIRQLNNRYIQQQCQKVRERTQIEQLAQKEKLFINQNKMKKLKTEQKYRAQNAQLAQISEQKSSDQVKYGENPFVSLVDRQDLRAKQTRQNFRLQNRLNDIQIAIQHQKKMLASTSNKKIGLQFDNFVQDQYQKHQKERDNFKNKYLSIKKWEQLNSDQIEEKQQHGSSSRKYFNYLNEQVEELKDRKKSQKLFLDSRSNQINKHVEVPDSSPAYLGRQPCSNDRKKQLAILDYNLSMNHPRKVRAASELYRSVEISPRQKQSQFQKSEPQERRAQSNLKLLPTIRKVSQLKSLNEITFEGELKFPSSINQNEKVTPSISLPPKNNRKYIKYDFIVGKNKTIII